MVVCGICNHDQGDEVQKLMEQLTHPHANKRLEAAEGLGKRGPAAKPALSALILRLVDFDALVRQAARQALVAIDTAWTADSVVKPVLPQLVRASGKSLTRDPRESHQASNRSIQGVIG